MQKKMRRAKIAALLAMGGMVFQLGGCLSTLPKNVWIGFGNAVGAIPVSTFIAPLLGDLLGIGGEEEEAE